MTKFELIAEADPELHVHHECEDITRTLELVKHLPNPENYYFAVILRYKMRWFLCVSTTKIVIKFCPYCGMKLDEEVNNDSEST
jgi:adenine C2-methylase RlmN of 23S rRNA A2503 and tRNA A37